MFGRPLGAISLPVVQELAGHASISTSQRYIQGDSAAKRRLAMCRNDLVGDKFLEPFTAENHYQPARYFLWQTFVAGHPPDWGPYETI